MRREVLISIVLMCTVLGWAQNSILLEDFESAQGKQPPLGWTLDIQSGSNALDSFIFSDSLYHFPPGLTGQYALFDCYNGGQLGATNSNGIGEDVSLVSPIVSTDSLRSLFLKFDYALTSFSGAGILVEVSTDGNSWTTVFSRFTSTNGSFYAHLNLNTYLNQDSFQFRLRWQNNSTINNQGYGAFDNVQLIERLDNDVAIGQIQAGAPLPCALQSQDLKILVRNEGLNAQSNLPIQLTLSGIVNQSFSDTINNIPSNSELEVDFGQVYFPQNGALYAEAEVFLSNDSLSSNNHLVDSFITSDTPSTPTGIEGQRCGAGKVDLFASSESKESTYWFENKSGGILLEKGDSFTTPVLSSTSSYYAENVVEVNQMLSTYQGPWRYNGSPTGGSYFSVTANRNLVIDSLFQHCAYSANNVIVTVYHKDGSFSGFERNQSLWAIVYKDTINSTGWGKYIAMDIQDILLYRGETSSFYITVSGSASPTFKQEVIDREYNDLDLMAEGINNIAFGSVLSGYSWDGKLHYKNLCSSPRVEIKAVIKDKPKGSKWVSSNVDNGQFNGGMQNDPDVTASGSSISYRIVAPDGYNWSDYGSLWEITAIELGSSSGVSLPPGDTTWSLDSAQDQLIYTPQSSWLDSTVVLTVHIVSLKTLCDTSITRYIYVAPTPQLKFQANDVCQGDNMNFTNQSSIDKGFSSYRWFFGNGDSSEQPSPSYQYQDYGKFSVTLSAISNLGVKASIQEVLEVFEVPKVDFSIVNACEGEDLSFDNSSSISTGTMDFRWDFGDGDSSNFENPMHRYDSSGNYKVVLMASSNGCYSSIQKQAYQFARPRADFVQEGNCHAQEVFLSNASEMKANEPVGVSWIINGQKLNGQRISYTFDSPGDHPITFIAQSQFGCADSLFKTVEMDESPLVAFNWDKSCDQSPTQFSNISLNSGPDSIYFVWDFGDGATSKEKNPMHQFSEVGEYMVTLVAVSTNGCTDRGTNTLFIGSEPIAEFDMASSCSGEEVQFVNKTRNTFGSIDFIWKFGDGSSSGLYAPRHTYNVNQTTIFNVSLEVISSNGCSSEFNKSIQIGVEPNCSFTYVQSKEDRQVFQFIPDVDNYAKYTWLFQGDGVSFETSPEHRFTYADWDYKVSLIAETEEGCICNESSLELTTSWTASLSDRTIAGLNLYPNPLIDFLYLELENAQEEFFIVLYNSLGKKVEEFGLIKLGTEVRSIDLSALTSGVYILELRQENKVAIYQIIIQ